MYFLCFQLNYTNLVKNQGVGAPAGAALGPY